MFVAMAMWLGGKVEILLPAEKVNGVCCYGNVAWRKGRDTVASEMLNITYMIYLSKNYPKNTMTKNSNLDT